MNQSAIQNILNETFTQLQKSNARYCVRAFSKKVAVSAGTMSLVMLGKRKVSPRLAKVILNKLLVPPEIQYSILVSRKGSGLSRAFS